MNSVAPMLLTMVVCGSVITQAATGAVYTVGDLAGWTTIGKVNYQLWAANKTFNLGDTIVFTYNKQFHNVLQVKHIADYRSCNISAAIATHSTGNDSIIIKTYGHHFYLCAVPGHCQAGQRVDINVQRVSPTMAPTPSSSIPPAWESFPSPSSSPTSDIVNKPDNSAGEATSLTVSLFKILVLFALCDGLIFLFG